MRRKISFRFISVDIYSTFSKTWCFVSRLLFNGAFLLRRWFI